MFLVPRVGRKGGVLPEVEAWHGARGAVVPPLEVPARDDLAWLQTVLQSRGEGGETAPH